MSRGIAACNRLIAAATASSWPGASSSVSGLPGRRDIQITGGNVTLNPGIYVLTGGLTISGSATVQGNGVMFFPHLAVYVDVLREARIFQRITQPCAFDRGWNTLANSTVNAARSVGS